MGPTRIHACGLMKSGPLFELYKDYNVRMRFAPELFEYHVKDHKNDLSLLESQNIVKNIKKDDFLIALDERGESLSTNGLYELLSRVYADGKVPSFAIGGATGHHQTLRDASQKIISVGKMVWPHMMVRVMLIEQLYRIQQIHAGHPYHKS
jgi:23S rRNA (pseudouridine1915-N3)-methyltransferase